VQHCYLLNITDTLLQALSVISFYNILNINFARNICSLPSSRPQTHALILPWKGVETT
jgi:hypothetical protein